MYRHITLPGHLLELGHCVLYWVFVLLVFLLIFGGVALYSRAIRPRRVFRQARKRPVNDAQESTVTQHYFKAKPDWIKKEIIQLKALMRTEGCRKISNAFNRQYKSTDNITVGKTYVANVIRDHQYQIQVISKKLKHLPPKKIPKQLIWGVDLTFKTDTQKQTHAILGVVEHYSRNNLTLAALKDKATTTLLRHLLVAIETYGKPEMIRTDNEVIFTSRLFTLTLWLLGIKHQRTDIHSPWQNGRIERFFGTLKQKLNRLSVDSLEELNQDLGIFRFWYNKVRTHNNLNGRTPEEVWLDIDIYKQPSKDIYYFNEWDGLLSGFYHPP